LPVTRFAISGSPYLGVYLRIGERIGLVPPSTPAAIERDIVRLFGVQTIRTTVRDSEILGAMVATTSFGVVVGDLVDESERAALENIGPLAVIRGRQNALGNNVLANDHGALVNPELTDDTLEAVRRALKVPVHRGTVAGLGTVGMAAVATNKGVVVHPRTSPKEAERLTEVLKVPLHRSTANFGVPIVGACLVANSKAVAVGRPTTPVEIVHLQEGLQIFD
jgi:translation initiation factor 6